MTAIAGSRCNTVAGKFLSWRVESVDLRSFDLALEFLKVECLHLLNYKIKLKPPALLVLSSI
jgi:hypothetical protein